MNLLLTGTLPWLFWIAIGTLNHSSPVHLEIRAQCRQDAAPEQSQRARISGRVVRRDTGLPIFKATVTIWPATQARESVTVRTDSTGKFEFSELVPRSYRLRAQHRGFVAQLYGQKGSGPGQTILVAPGQDLSRIDFSLEPAGALIGVILDEDHEPVEGVEVFASRVRFNAGGRRQTFIVRSARTDDAGNYRLAGLAPGFYYVQAGGRGEGVGITTVTSSFSYVPTFYPSASSLEEARIVEVNSGSETRGIDVSVKATKTYSILGAIADASAGTAERRYSVGFARGGGTATMDSVDGSFALRGLAPGDYTLFATVSEEGKPTRRGYRNVTIVDADLRVAIAVGSAAEVRGKLLWDGGSAGSFAGLRVALTPENPDAVFQVSPVDANGTFRVGALPPGSYEIHLNGREDEVYLKKVECLSEDFSGKPIILEANQHIEDCRLTLSRDVSTVSGDVLKGGSPGAGLVIVLVPQQRELRRNPRYTVTTQSESRGTFSIAGVVPGEYFLFAVPPTDDQRYFDLEFPEKNQHKAVRIKVAPKETHTARLSFEE